MWATMSIMFANANTSAKFELVNARNQGIPDHVTLGVQRDLSDNEVTRIIFHACRHLDEADTYKFVCSACVGYSYIIEVFESYVI